MSATLIIAAVVAAAALYVWARYFRWFNTVVGSRFRDDVPVAEDGEPLFGHNRVVRKNARRRLERQVALMKKHGGWLFRRRLQRVLCKL